ncbi:MAG: hypothetical protein SF029_13995 [bacterium]|nr:hypothetical protein [bacterium]
MLRRGWLLLFLVALVGCTPTRPTRPEATIEVDLEQLPRIRPMAEFPGSVSGFRSAGALQILIDEQVCLRIERSVLADEGDALPVTITLGTSILTSTQDQEGQMNRYCFLVEAPPGYHIVYVDLQTVTGEEVYSWEFLVDPQ